MQKKKRWHLVLILAVAALTVYNILPTVFFYTKPLSSSIDEPKAVEISAQVAKRINALEPQALAWIDSFCDLLHIKPSSITQDKNNQEFISVAFSSAQDASILRKYLPRAGALIPFTPSQLSLYGDAEDGEDTVVKIKRNIPVHFDTSSLGSFFQFSKKLDDNGKVAPLYQALITDRLKQIALSSGGMSQNAKFAEALLATTDADLSLEIAFALSDNIVSFSKAFNDSPSFTNRFFSSLTQLPGANKQQIAGSIAEKITVASSSLSKEVDLLSQEEAKLKSQGNFLDSSKLQLKASLSHKATLLKTAADLIKKNKGAIADGTEAWTYSNITPVLQENFLTIDNNSIQTLPLNGKNPFIQSIQIDWKNGTISLNLYEEITQLKTELEKTDTKRLEQVDQFLFNEIATISREADETITEAQNGYLITLSEIPESKSFLAFKLSSVAAAESNDIKNLILSSWNPRHADLQPNVFPVIDYTTYLSLPADEKGLSLIVYSPVIESKAPEAGFRMNSVYVIAKGMDKILKKFKDDPSSSDSKIFIEDFQKLRSLLSKSGYMGYEASLLNTGKEFAGDFIFEAPDYFQNVLAASREAFYVKGTKRYAVLEFSNKEQRILAENKIDSAIHEDLLQWRDDYRAAQLSIKGVSRFDVPKPTQNVLLSNLKLSAVKYFRGDERKILHWGLDLSGGKTVQIELRDTNNKLVSNEADIKQGINELYSRVNKMGVSEVSIRQEGDLITLDFPGSQSLSADELIKASSMLFHVVNEKFTPNNGALADSTNKFLQEVWNEAVVTNRKTTEDINRIACKHLYGDSLDPEVIQPRSEAAKALYDNGLRLTLPTDYSASSLYNDTFSKITMFRGEDYTEWHGQTHPLLVVFRNFALEGSDLENVHASYDPSRGNFLSFGVRSSYTSKEGLKITPREDFSSWTTPFSKEKITGTANGQISHNQGWRMAVILNGSVVSAPTLDSALKDSAMITGSFSQREINQLESDLKAGSLSFTPKILSEKNVSPELGSKERSMGILATIASLILVVGVMSFYYRLAGVIASIAVIFNILIMWATLQNIQATLTLASLAGLILTVGMAVDANVLVFERIREEFASKGRIASAIQAGYKKAFSAILDSNVTTIIAALILLQFDSGPIKGFAVTLIIGIVSSMFTALFVTKYLFSLWSKNPKNTALSMANWFKAKKFNFLRYAKVSMIASISVIVLGGALFSVERHSIFGMDFTGGYALNLELSPVKDLSYRQVVEKALVASGAKPQEIQVRELSPSNSVKIFLSKNLALTGRPLDGLVASSGLNGTPQIDWVISSLKKANIDLPESCIDFASQNWSEVSGQMSQTMRNSALIGLLIALLCIFIYITIRFEFKYAISATICLAHDLFFTFAAIALLHALGVSVQIDLTTIAALMTIAGYSLNDTIIVFDRIREETKGMKKTNLPDIINRALNITLSRTVLTSGTTLVALIPLIAMGGSTIFSFTLVMAIGIIFGTLSSLFIAAPLMLLFHKREEQKQQRIALNS
jgi:SecD/SecF fusion protein